MFIVRMIAVYLLLLVRCLGVTLLVLVWTD